jgi:hypothetical protein
MARTSAALKRRNRVARLSARTTVVLPQIGTSSTMDASSLSSRSVPGCGSTAQERLGARAQAEESYLYGGARTNAARRSSCWIGQITEGDLARSDRIVTHDLGARVMDDHLVLTGSNFDVFTHQ